NFEISDTGIGIDADKIDYIFDSYAQANSDTTRKYGGTGLGLAITKRLLDLHHSEIIVKSQIGKGSTFSFNIEFPKSKDESRSESDSSVSTFSDLNAAILVVDDNEMNRILAGKVLKKWGVHVEYAVNGKEAVDMVLNRDYDLVLMDLHMPVMDGMEASRTIRSKGGKYKNIPIVALTASLFAKEMETISSSGMNGYVMKPFVP